jgi:hypothetical protein
VNLKVVNLPQPTCLLSLFVPFENEENCLGQLRKKSFEGLPDWPKMGGFGRGNCQRKNE